MTNDNGGENEAGRSTSTSEYTIPKPSRIKMKETKAEKAHRLYRREQRRLAKEDQRISRANGYAVSPPRQYREESMSPPRKRPTNANTTTYSTIDLDDDDAGDGGGGGEWMGGHGRRAKEELEKREFEEKLSWMAGEDYGFSFGTSGGGGLEEYEDIHIPKRFKDAAGSSSSTTIRSRRDAAAEVGGIGIPPIGSMTDSEYTQFIREGMYAKKHKAELEEAQRRQRVKEERERMEQAKREQKRKEEEKKIKRLKMEKSENVERLRKEERGKWAERWKILGEVGGEVELTNITFGDIPWPIHHPSSTKKITLEDLTRDSIRSFLFALAEDTKTESRKIIREAIRLFHPDRFHGRILTRVKEDQRDEVKQGVEGVSRILNDLAAEVK